MVWSTGSSFIVNPSVNEAEQIITKSPLPIGLIPQVFELYNWLRRSGFKNLRLDDYEVLGYSGMPNLDDIKIPDGKSIVVFFMRWYKCFLIKVK